MFNRSYPDYVNTPASDRRAEYPYVQGNTGEQPVVTLVTPFFNTGEEFHETVVSAMRQSLQNFEWIVVNDGSEDPGALAVLDMLRKRGDKRVQIIDLEENAGVSAARNLGIERARSPYIAFLDSDDLIEPTALEKWVWFLATQPEFPWVNSFTIGFDAREYFWEEGFHLPHKFLERNGANPIGAYRTSFLREMEGYDAGIVDGLEDWDFWLRAASSGHWGYTLPDPLIWYRRRDNHADRWDDFDEGQRGQTFRERLREKYSLVWRDGFPRPERLSYANAPLREEIPFSNSLATNDSDGKRLLLILPHMECGGSDKFNLDLCESLVRDHGWQVTIVTTLGSGGGAWLHRIAAITPDFFILGRFLSHADYPRFLSYLIGSRGVDSVVVSHSCLGYQLAPYLKNQHPDVVFADYLHIEMERWKSGGYPRSSTHYHEALDLTMTSSQHLKEWVVERGTPAEMVEVVTTNIDGKQWNPEGIDTDAVRSRFNLDAEAPIVLFAGRLVEQKRPRLLGQIAVRLVAKLQHAPFQLVIAGGGDDFGWFEKLIEKHDGLDGRIHLLGEVTNEDVSDLLGAADVFLLPSEHEGIALALYEAMAMECAVVASEVGGQAELVTRGTGVLLPIGDGGKREAESYVRELTTLLMDLKHCQKVGEAARQRVLDEFPLEAMVSRVRELLTSQSLGDRSLSENGLRLAVVEACEQARLEDESAALWRENQKLLGQRDEMRAKLENFRGMIARRNEKIDKLEETIDEERDKAGRGSLFGSLGRKPKRSRD